MQKTLRSLIALLALCVVVAPRTPHAESAVTAEVQGQLLMVFDDGSRAAIKLEE